MNMFLKVLGAIAMVMVILASGVYVLRNLDPHEGKSIPSKDDDAKKSDEPKGKKVADELVPPPRVEITPITVKPDHPLQPSYKPINQPEYLKFLRGKGKTYRSTVVGKVSGQASKRDWGFQGTAYFDYLFTVSSASKILKNDGVEVVEERSFSQVDESLFVSHYEIGLEIPDQLGTALNWIGNALGAGNAVSATLSTVNHRSVSIKKEWIDQARGLGLFKTLPDLDPARLEQELRMFTQGDNNRLLAGKTVKIRFVDGTGVTNIDPVSGGLTQQEKEIIIRTNFVMDHYLFPDHEVKPGGSWTVAADVFAGFLDPRLKGKPEGKVKVLRTPDHEEDGQISKKLRIAEGDIMIRNVTGANEITGQLNGLKGVCVIPDKNGVVTAAFLSGYADYKSLSRDHLLFQAQTTYTPKIEIRYECKVE